MLVSVRVFLVRFGRSRTETERWKKNPLDRDSLQTFPSWRRVSLKLTWLGQGESKTHWMCGYHATRVKRCASEQKGQSEVLTCGPSYPGGVIGGTGLATWGPGRLVSALFHTCHTEGQLRYCANTQTVQASNQEWQSSLSKAQHRTTQLLLFCSQIRGTLIYLTKRDDWIWSHLFLMKMFNVSI